MKKYKWLILCLAVIVALVIVSIVFSEDESKYLHEISMNDVVKKIENEDDFILFIKQTDCEHCKAFTPNLISVLSANDLEAYVLNISDLGEDQELYDNTFDVEGTPTVLFFEDGNESLIKIEGNQTKAKVKSKLESAGFIK